VNAPIPFDQVLNLAEEAGQAILAIYGKGKGGKDVAVERKADDTPLTEADRSAHRIIAEGLARLTPAIPVLSEEGREIPYAEREGWPRLWIVDPLDGTKEFLNRNGEFTVNIALAEGNRTAWGVVHAPVSGLTYWGGAGFGAFRRGNGKVENIRVRPPRPGEGLIALKSRSHPSAELDAYLSKLPIAETVSLGSSLKFCAVAEGRAHLYARFGPTSEWDTAAGHALLEGAGGRMHTMEGAPFLYNKPCLRNGPFIADTGV
jgi:3'(2'), 5'-bisphosphate nucleotidase